MFKKVNTNNEELFKKEGAVDAYCVANEQDYEEDEKGLWCPCLTPFKLIN